jgi:hypothetical protein
MVHYIRFLRTPYVSNVSRKAIDVASVVTVTTDLGDSFYANALDLVVRLVDATNRNEVLCSEVVRWHEGSRAVKFAVSCNANLTDRLISVNLTTENSMKAWTGKQVPGILDVWSLPFTLTDGQRTDPLVERRLLLRNGNTLRVREETGDSIARHIW